MLDTMHLHNSAESLLDQPLAQLSPLSNGQGSEIEGSDKFLICASRGVEVPAAFRQRRTHEIPIRSKRKNRKGATLKDYSSSRESFNRALQAKDPIPRAAG